MKIIFNHDGSIKALIIGEYIQQGNSGVDHIEVGVDGYDNESVVVSAIFTLPNGDTNTLSAQPSNVEFDNATYLGWKITLTQAQTLYYGELLMSLRVNDTSDNLLFTYKTSLTINKTPFVPDEQTISQAQWNSLQQTIASLQLKYGQGNVRKYPTIEALESDTDNLAEGQVALVRSGLTGVEAYEKQGALLVQLNLGTEPPVTSVNEKTGVVVLSASDINASDGESVQENLDRIETKKIGYNDLKDYEKELIVNGVSTEVTFNPTIDGCIRYDNGTVSGDLHTKHTDYVRLVGRKSLKYNGGITSGKCSIAFFNSNKEYIQAVSVSGTSSGTIDLTQVGYENCAYAIVSGYNASDDFSSFYIKLQPYVAPTKVEDTDSNFQDLLKRLPQENATKYGFTSGKYLLWGNGKASANANGGVTDYISLFGIKNVIYQVNMGTTGVSVAFYDKDKNYLQNISVQGNGVVGSGQGCIDITKPAYANAKFVRFSVYIVGANFTNYYGITVGGNQANDNLPQFANKNVLIFGDSITDCCYFQINASKETTEYYFRNPSTSYWNGTETKYFNMWAKLLKDRYPFNEVRNYAKSGASFVDRVRTSGNERQNLSYQIEVALNDLDNPNNAFPSATFSPDIIIFALGTNDSANGSVNDTYASAMAKTVYKADNTTIDIDATLSNLNKENFNEAVRFALLTMKKNFPMAQIYVSLPIQRVSYDLVGSDLVNDLRKMAERYGCIIIDSTTKSGIIRDDNTHSGRGITLQDGLHPNEKGQNLLARCIINSLKDNYIDLNKMNQ